MRAVLCPSQVVVSNRFTNLVNAGEDFVCLLLPEVEGLKNATAGCLCILDGLSSKLDSLSKQPLFHGRKGTVDCSLKQGDDNALLLGFTLDISKHILREPSVSRDIRLYLLLQLLGVQNGLGSSNMSTRAVVALSKANPRVVILGTDTERRLEGYNSLVEVLLVQLSYTQCSKWPADSLSL
ncbi:hypothetical protein HG530_015616 [Fusarium avenaceum]|nr:hypothetical protein HG530_015616 [Fusarium avenaceum]